MIGIKVTVIGQEGMAQKLADAESGLRPAIRAELWKVGEEIIAGAQAAAPKRTGIMASKIVQFFGRMRKRGRGLQRRTMPIDAKNPRGGKIEWEVRPGGRVAHLVERGVNGAGRTRTINIAPRPFFMPAVDAVGGPAGVNARLQTAIDNFAGDVNGA